MRGDTALGLSDQEANLLILGGAVCAVLFGIGALLGDGALFGALTVLAGMVALLGQVADIKLKRMASDPNRFDCTRHPYPEANKVVLEIHPRGATLKPFVVLVPNAERESLMTVQVRSRGAVPNGASYVEGKNEIEEGEFSGVSVESPVDPHNSAFVWFRGSPPSEVRFGQEGGRLRSYKPSQEA